jgi:hypothetical protein
MRAVTPSHKTSVEDALGSRSSGRLVRSTRRGVVGSSAHEEVGAASNHLGQIVGASMTTIPSVRQRPLEGSL